MEDKKRILLIDHPTLHSLILHRIIVDEGYRCSLANDRKEALSLMKRNDYDLIILDVTLMDIEGMALLKSLKVDPVYAPIPVIALSVKGETTKMNGALRLGAVDCLMKPFNVQKLLNKITQIFKFAY
ncbi:MAG: PleD family two-component system response regulator [Bacteroidales bacterium]